MAGECNVFGGLDCGTDGGWVEGGKGTEAGVEKELGCLRVRRLVGALLRGRRKGGIDVADENPLTQVAGAGFAKFGDLGVGLGGGSDDVEPGDAAIEPEAGDVGEIGGGNFRVEVEQDADVAAASFVDEFVEIVEGTVDEVEGLGMGRVGLECGEKESVNAEGVNVVETLGDTVETAASGGTEVDRVYLVDDRTFPPDVCGDAGASPAGTGKDLGFGGSACDKRGGGAGETKGKESAEVWCDHSLLLEMLREKASERN
jgi:hypothetical protein